jgi:hypothetical protein
MNAVAVTLATAAAPVRGPATYFNGVTSKRHDVIVQTAATSLCIIGDDRGSLVDEWNYADLRGRSAPAGILRLGRRGEEALARLVIRDATLAAAIEERAPSLDRGGATDRALRRRVVVLSLAAIAKTALDRNRMEGIEGDLRGGGRRRPPGQSAQIVQREQTVAAAEAMIEAATARTKRDGAPPHR